MGGIGVFSRCFIKFSYYGAFTNCVDNRRGVGSSKMLTLGWVLVIGPFLLLLILGLEFLQLEFRVSIFI